MYPSLALLCLVAAAVDGYFLGDHHDQPHGLIPGLKVKNTESGGNMFKGRNDMYGDLPLSNCSAASQGYILMNRPRLLPGYCSMQLWCRPSNNYRFCIFTDETSETAGVQYNIPRDEFQPKYDMRQLGFTIWTTTHNNNIVRFYAYYVMFASPHAKKRIESKDPTIIVRDNELHYSGFDGKMASVATEISRLDSIFTRQNCLQFMGHQYYYNMTKELECGASTLSPFSAMFYANRLVGFNINVIGHFTKSSGCKDLYGKMNAINTKFAIPRGPTCLYQDVASKGALTETIYLTSTPWQINCRKH